MRVLAVGNMYPPHHLGGYELVWRGAMRHLRARGDEVRVLTTTHRELTEAPDEPGVARELEWYWRDHAFPRIGLRARVALERRNRARLERNLEELRPDVVTWWSMGGMSLGLLEVVRRRGLPALAFVHDDWLVYGPRADAWQKGFRGPLRRLAPVAERLAGVPAAVDLAGAARYLFVSEHTRRAAPPLPDTGIAHSGIDPGLLDHLAPERPWQGRLLYVGRIDERKGIDTAVEALAHLPAATLRVVGSGDPAAQASLVARARALGVLDRLELAGTRSREELAATYAEADAVLFPVIWEEPWGLVPLEAMAVGRAVVATGRGGSGEYLRDGVNAVLHRPADAAALARAVDRLAADEALRARLRAAGRETAARHTDRGFHAQVAAELDRIVL